MNCQQTDGSNFIFFLNSHPHFSFVSLRRVGQEAGVHVLQVRPAGADRGDAEGVAAVSATAAPLVGSVVRVVEGLGVGAWAATAASGLRQLPTARHKTTAGQSESLTESCQRSSQSAGRGGQTHSLQRFMMPPFFLARRVLLADSDSGSISQDRL